MTACRDQETPAAQPGAPQRRTESYGPGSRQYGEWSLPAAPGRARLPVVMLLHGGYWQPSFGPYLERPVAVVLAQRGFAVWNVDYRAADEPWPATFLDAAAGLDHLASSRLARRLDLERVAVVGHSAGGLMALWLASRSSLPPGAPGVPSPRSVTVRLAVGQAPVTDLVRAAREELGGGAAQQLLDGSPADVPARYARASPAALLPVRGVRLLLVHGDNDNVVPLSQSETYAQAAGQAAELRVVRGAGHFEHLDPDSRALAPVYEALDELGATGLVGDRS